MRSGEAVERLERPEDIEKLETGEESDPDLRDGVRCNEVSVNRFGMMLV